MLTAMIIHDLIAELRRTLGDEIAFEVVRVAAAVAGGWGTATDHSNRRDRLFEVGLSLKAAGLEPRARAAHREHASKTRTEHDWLTAVFALVNSGNLVEALEGEKRRLDALLAELRRPVPRAGVPA